MRLHIASLFAALTTSMLLSMPASACPSCACGVQNPTRLGADVPFAGRARVGVVSTTSTLHEDDMVLLASDVTVAGSVALTDVLVVEGAVPLSTRLVVQAAGITGRGVGLGDGRVGVRMVAWRDRAFAPRLLVAARLQAVLPTAPMLFVRGVPVAMALQPGGGAVAVNGGLALLGRPTSRLLLGVDVAVQTPLLTIRDNASAGTTGQLSTSAQFDVTDLLAVRGMAAVQATHAPLSTHGLEAGSKMVSDRGSVYGGLGLSFTFSPSLLGVLDVEVPVSHFGTLTAQDGARATAGIVFDL
jgi:hypothetical protein